MDAKPTQYIETTHPLNVNSTLAFHKVAFFHQHFNINIAAIPPPRVSVQVMAYTDDITITSTHKNMSAAKKYTQPYLHEVFSWTKQNISH